jgi:hypothetical protein
MRKLAFSPENFTQQGVAETVGVLAILSVVSFWIFLKIIFLEVYPDFPRFRGNCSQPLTESAQDISIIETSPTKYLQGA